MLAATALFSALAYGVAYAGAAAASPAPSPLYLPQPPESAQALSGEPALDLGPAKLSPTLGWRLVLMVTASLAGVAAMAVGCLGFRRKKEPALPLTKGGGQPIVLKPPSDALATSAAANPSSRSSRDDDLAQKAQRAQQPRDDPRVELSELEARQAEPLNALSLLRLCYSPIQGLQVTGLLGQGAMGRVYTAMWTGRGPVAVKVMEHSVHHAGSSQLDKAPVLCTVLNHPNVVATYHVATIRLPSPPASPRGDPRLPSEELWEGGGSPGLSDEEVEPSWLPPAPPVTQQAQQAAAAAARQQQPQDGPVHFLDEQRASDSPLCAELLACRDLVRHPSQHYPSPLARGAGPGNATAATAATADAQRDVAGAGAGTGPPADLDLELGTGGGYAGGPAAAGAAGAVAAACSETEEGPRSSLVPSTPGSLDWAVSPFQLAATAPLPPDSGGSGQQEGGRAAAPPTPTQPPAAGHSGSVPAPQERSLGSGKSFASGPSSWGLGQVEEGEAVEGEGGPLAAAHALAAPLKPGMYEVWLVQELCTFGSLGECLKKRKLVRRPDGSHRTACIFGVLMDVARGMEFLHSRAIVHGELRAGNVLLQRSSTDHRGFLAKVGDHGLSGLVDSSQTHIHSRSMGSVGYLAPEVITQGRLDKQSDVYSFGMLMYEAWTCERIFPHMTAGQVFRAVVKEGARPPVPADCPGRYAALMRACWEEDPHNRPTFFIIVRELHAQLKEFRRHERHDAAQRTQQAQRAASLAGSEQAQQLDQGRSMKSMKSLGAAVSVALDI